MQQNTNKPVSKGLESLQIVKKQMKKQMNKMKNQIKKMRWGFLGMGFMVAMMAATQVFAQVGSADPLNDSDDNSSIQRVEEIKATKGKGWQISTKGGLKYINPDDQRYWFAIGGTVRLDQVFYSGSQLDKQGQFPNSGFVRRIEPGIDGGIGENWEYSANFAFSTIALNRGTNNPLGQVQDTWVGYTGFSKNSELFFGRLSGNWFGLDNSTGTTWMAFMERSAQANAFYPGDGVGIMGDIWWDDAAITVLLLEHDQGQHLFATDGGINRPFRGDRLKTIARYTYAPVHCLGDVWHFGVSGSYVRLDAILWDAPIRTASVGNIPPGGVSQRNRSNILNTGFFYATYSNSWNVEMARQWGPFIAEAEYTQMFVHQVGNPYQTSVIFKGWNLQSRYILTGEAHTYDVRDGSFGSIDICSPYGALEAAIRYDYVNLNDKNIHGGSQHDLTLGLNWFINPQLRLTANYVRSNFRPQASVTLPNQAIHRKLDVFAFRLQYKFK